MRRNDVVGVPLSAGKGRGGNLGRGKRTSNDDQCLFFGFSSGLLGLGSGVVCGLGLLLLFFTLKSLILQ